MAASTPRLPLVLAQRCTGCGRCVGACPHHLLSLETEHWKKTARLHDAPRCTGCSDCAMVCPFRAIVMRPRTVLPR
jgi:ferredoxin